MKVEKYDHLTRDPKTNAIINTNASEYTEYILRKESKNKENERIQNLENDLNNIKNDLNEIKFLLRNLSNGSK